MEFKKLIEIVWVTTTAFSLPFSLRHCVRIHISENYILLTLISSQIELITYLTCSRLWRDQNNVCSTCEKDDGFLQRYQLRFLLASKLILGEWLRGKRHFQLYTRHKLPRNIFDYRKKYYWNNATLFVPENI